MKKIEELPNNLPDLIKIKIQKMLALHIIQNRTKEYFIRKYGVNWKDIINYKWNDEYLQYYCER